jgi:hypothetical protein
MNGMIIDDCRLDEWEMMNVKCEVNEWMRKYFHDEWWDYLLLCVHYFATALLHYFATASLHYSATASLHYFATPSWDLIGSKKRWWRW